MKKRIVCFLLALLFLCPVISSCRLVADPLDELTPYEAWDAYILQNRGIPESVGYVDCYWIQNQGVPLSVTEQEEISVVFDRLKELTFSPEDLILVEDKWVYQNFNILDHVVIFTLSRYPEPDSEYVMPKVILQLYLRGNQLVIGKNGVFYLATLDSDKTDYKESLGSYFEEHDYFEKIIRAAM